MKEHLQVMCAMARDLKAVGQNISEEEQVLNGIRALPDTQYWDHFKLVMAHNGNIKPFETIFKHLKIEQECLKSFYPLVRH